MKVKYIGNENINRFELEEIYEVVNIVKFCGEDYYCFSNNEENNWCYKSNLFVIVEE